MRMKKFLTILLTFAMVLSLLPATAFAANNTATTMRLAKTQGTVTVTNSTDKTVTQTTNMKLYNGYKVKTSAKSYGWISLDETKVAKLDANSGTEVQKSGQKLTLYLSSGNIFFNVKDPLKSGESFHIKTSTMTTGIRGTSGCVRVVNDRVSEIHLLTGQVEVYVEDPLTGVTATATLKAGQKAKSMIADEAMAATGQQAGIVIEPLHRDEVCGNCAKEIAADPELADRIRREAPHLLPEEIAAVADQKLVTDEAAAEAKQDEIDEKVAAQVFPDDVDPYFEEKSGGGGGGGGSSSGGSGGSGGGNNDDNNGGEEETEPVTVSVDTWGGLSTAITAFNNGEAYDGVEDFNEIKLTQDISGENETDTLPPIESGESLTLNLGTSTLTLNDTLVNNGNLTITNEQGYITADITAYENHDYLYPELIRNNGTLTQEDGILVLPDEFGTCVAVVNEGTYNLKGGGIHNGEGNGASAVKNQGDGVFNMSGGTIDFAGSAAIENYAEMNMTGGTMNFSVITESYVWAIENYGDLTIDGEDAKIIGEDGFTYINEAGNEESAAVLLVYNEGTFALKNGTLSVGDHGTGVLNSATAIMTGGTVEVAGNSALGFNLGGGETTFSGGLVTAEHDNAKAVHCYHQELVSGKITSTIRAKAEDQVFFTYIDYVEPANAPPGYEVVYDEAIDYFVLKAEDEPETPPDIGGEEGEGDDSEFAEIVSVKDPGGFLEALLAFDGSEATKIELDVDDGITDENLEAFGIPENMVKVSSDKGTNLLVIDLKGHTLEISATPLVNQGNLRIIDSVGSGKITGEAAQLIENNNILELNGGTMDISASSAYRAVVNVGTMTMSGGTIISAQDTDEAAISVQTGKLTMTGGTISVTGDTAGIYAYNHKELTLKGGSIIAEDDNAICISFGGIGELTLADDAVVKGKNAEYLLVGYNGNGFKTVGPDEDDYYFLKQAPSQEEMTEAMYIFAEQLIAYNSGKGNQEIALRNDVPFDNAVLMSIKAFADKLAELGFDEFVVWNGGDVLTIDLNGHDLILESTLLIGSYSKVKIIDSVGGGKIRGSAMQEMFILSDGARLTLDGVAMEVAEEGQVGIDYRSTGALTFTETATMTVKGDGSFGIIAQGLDLTVPEGCIIVEGEGAEGILQ